MRNEGLASSRPGSRRLQDGLLSTQQWHMQAPQSSVTKYASFSSAMRFTYAGSENLTVRNKCTTDQQQTPRFVGGGEGWIRNLALPVLLAPSCTTHQAPPHMPLASTQFTASRQARNCSPQVLH